MRIPLTIVAVLALSALTSRLALATAPDELIPCKKLSVKVDKIDPTSGTVKFLCKAPKSGFALPQGTSSPVTSGFGVGLLIYDLGSTLFIVPGSLLTTDGWTGLGNPAGSKGFRYRNRAYDAPCRAVVVTTKQVAGTCRANIGPGSLPVVGDVGMRLHFTGAPADDKSYCAQFGGTPVRNDAAAFLRKNSPAPGSCPPLP